MFDRVVTEMLNFSYRYQMTFISFNMRATVPRVEQELLPFWSIWHTRILVCSVLLTLIFFLPLFVTLICFLLPWYCQCSELRHLITLVASSSTYIIIRHTIIDYLLLTTTCAIMPITTTNVSLNPAHAKILSK